jgi:Domain of unknown function (DUF1814).
MFIRLIEKVADALEKTHIPYMIIGGQAVLLYGEPRLTKDIDITLGVGLSQVRAIRDLAQSIGLRVLVDPDVFTRQTFVLPCEDPETGIRVDFVFSFSPYERQAMERVNRVQIGQVQVRFASLEDVIIHKIVAGRARDIEDVRSILIKHDQFDEEYIRRWLQEFSLALQEPLIERFETVLQEARSQKH